MINKGFRRDRACSVSHLSETQQTVPLRETLLIYKGPPLTKLYLNSKLIPGDVREAKGFAERAIGLIGSKTIEEGFFLLFRRCNSIHTFFMSVEIDAVMLDKQGVVQYAKESLKPWKFGVCMAAADTLEMKAGSISKYGIKKGDTLKFS